MPPPAKVGLTVAEVAERTGKSASAIRAMIRDGELYADTSGAAWIVPIREVHRVWGTADFDSLRLELAELVQHLVDQRLAERFRSLTTCPPGPLPTAPTLARGGPLLPPRAF